jgi:hypothetical protein
VLSVNDRARGQGRDFDNFSDLAVTSLHSTSCCKQHNETYCSVSKLDGTKGCCSFVPTFILYPVVRNYRSDK